VQIAVQPLQAISQTEVPRHLTLSPKNTSTMEKLSTLPEMDPKRLIKTEKEDRYGMIRLNILDALKMDRGMEQVKCCIQIRVFMLVLGAVTRRMGMASKYGKMEMNIKVIGKTIKWKATENSHYMMALFTKAT
jgi:hypothetical protein